jgi:hypothetical protein
MSLSRGRRLRSLRADLRADRSWRTLDHCLQGRSYGFAHFRIDHRLAEQGHMDVNFDVGLVGRYLGRRGKRRPLVASTNDHELQHVGRRATANLANRKPPVDRQIGILRLQFLGEGCRIFAHDLVESPFDLLLGPFVCDRFRLGMGLRFLIGRDAAGNPARDAGQVRRDIDGRRVGLGVGHRF